MRRLPLQVLVLWIGLSLGRSAALAAAAADHPGNTPLIRLHFGGFEALAATTNTSTLAKISRIPETAELSKQTVARLAHAAARMFEPRDGAAAARPAALITPLLNILARYESLLEVAGDGNAARWTFAVQAPADARSQWQASSSEFISKYKLKDKWGHYQLAAFATNSWLVLSLAPQSVDAATKPELHSPLLDQIRSHGEPAAKTSRWLALDAHWPRLRQLFPVLPSWPIDRLALTVGPRGDNLRSEGRITYAQPQQWQLERWTVPVQTITDPQATLMSFTAVQGIGSWLARQDCFKPLEINPPNQLFVWAQAYGPFAGQIQAAADVGNATNFLARVNQEWVPSLKSTILEHGVGQLQMTNNRILWSGLPIVVPDLTPAPDPGFVVAGLLPLPLSTNQAPRELIQQLTGRTNLIYYDWEITQARLAQLRALAQLTSLILTVPTLGTNELTGRWLDAIQPMLGNAITEAAVGSPTELAVTRTSPIGLNGLELLGLAFWLQSTNFPQMQFDLQFRTSAAMSR